MRRAIYSIAIALGAVGLAGCEASYVYRPAVSTTAATVAGQPASYYGIPPEGPQGHVRLATLGFAEIRARANPDEELKALQLRMIVANNSDTKSWWVDTREQRALLPGVGESRPAYATVKGGTPPLVEVPPRSERTINLFYPLPAHMQGAKEVPQFDVLWQVDTASRRVVERTPFERVEIDTSPSTYPYPSHYAWGGPYYYDPFYPRGGWYGMGFGAGYYGGGSNVIISPGAGYSAPPGRRVR